jgi:hypothetical protein
MLGQLEVNTFLSKCAAPIAQLRETSSSRSLRSRLFVPAQYGFK